MPSDETPTDVLLGLETMPVPRFSATGDGLIPGLTILHHPRAERVGDIAVLTGLLSQQPVSLSRLEPLFAPPGGIDGRPLADPGLSRKPATLRAVRGGIELTPAPQGSLIQVNGKPLKGPRFFEDAALARGVVLELSAGSAVLLHTDLPLRRDSYPAFGLVGESGAMLALRRDVARVADLKVPVLLRGESGTGKELVARAIHQGGSAARRRLVAVNMAAIPGSMAASELFGHARGAFTGAVTDHPGYFRSADKGTLFLDEIGDAPPEIQVALLRVLETSEVQPLGARSPIRVDVRLVAATDADLERSVEDGGFRNALLQRLSGYQIRIPPLRDRRDDIGRLIIHFLREELAEADQLDRLSPTRPGAAPWLPAGLVARLVRHDWPGNVRQLRNVVRQIVIANRFDDQVRFDGTIAELLGPEPDAPPQSNRSPEPRQKPSEIGEDELVEALRANGWSVLATARALGISRTSLHELMDASPRARRPKDIPDEELRRCHAECGGDVRRMSEQLEVSARGLTLRLKSLGLR